MPSETASIGYHGAGLLRRRWIVSLFLPLYVLAFGEMFLRIMAPAPIVPRYVTGAPYGVRMGMPNMRFFQMTPETRAEIRTNSRGIRADREYPYEKPPGTCRIVLLGDSLLVGYEVNLEDSFAYLLQRRLQARGYRCEVINLAVSGFGTAEMLVTLREEALKYHPDLVLFSSHVTDLDDNVRSALFALDASGRLVRDKPAFLPGIRISDELSRFAAYRWLVEHSQLYSAIRERVAHAVKAALVDLRRPRKFASKAKPAPDSAGSSRGYAWTLNLRLQQEARRLSDLAGARFCVLELPVGVSRTRIVRMMPDYRPGEAQGLNVFSPLARLRASAAPERKLFFEKGHGHLTPMGNRIVTDYFYDELEKTGWLEPWRK